MFAQSGLSEFIGLTAGIGLSPKFLPKLSGEQAKSLVRSNLHALESERSAYTEKNRKEDFRIQRKMHEISHRHLRPGIARPDPFAIGSDLAGSTGDLTVADRKWRN